MTLALTLSALALLSAACFAGAWAIGRRLQTSEPDEHERGGG